MIPALTPARAAEMAKGAFDVQPVSGDLDGALRILADAGQDDPAFLLTDGAEQYLVTSPRPDRLAAAMPDGHSARWRGLAASVLRELLIRDAWGLRDEEPDVVVAPGDAAAAVAGRPPGRRDRGDLQPGVGRGCPRGRRERGADAAQVDVVRPQAADRHRHADLRGQVSVSSPVATG